MESNYEKFKRIVSQYEGVITETEECIEITAKNEIASYYASGKVFKRKVVPCTIGCRKDRNSLYGHEKTYEIIGGFGQSFDEESLLRNLERYNFKKKTASLPVCSVLKGTQISLFD